ncbi:MAG: DNA-3-methyladenine glycosylase I [Polyangiaceae bacterium]
MATPRAQPPEKSADYLNVISRAVFSAGLSWAIIDAKWDAFEEAFEGFELSKVAAMSEPVIERLAADARLISSRKKIAATVENAKALLAIEREHGSIRAWLDSFPTYDEAARAVSRTFKYLSKTFGAYYFLYIASAKIPDFPAFEQWSKQTGEVHPRMRELVAAREQRKVGGPSRKPQPLKRRR